MSAEITGTGGVKVKSGINRDGPSKGKFDCKYLTNKKIESSTKQLPADSKNKSVFKPVKSDENAKTTAFSSKITAKTATTPVKRERKIYSLPGQRYDPPEEREPLRIFYESLSQQIPPSEMAEFCWFLAKLGFLQFDPTPLHADNTRAIQIVANPIYHERSRHAKVDCHCIREAFNSLDGPLYQLFVKLIWAFNHLLAQENERKKRQIVTKEMKIRKHKKRGEEFRPC